MVGFEDGLGQGGLGSGEPGAVWGASERMDGSLGKEVFWMSGGVLALLAVVIVVIVAMALMNGAADRERGEVLRVWARERGWGYDRERPELVDRFAGAPFRRGPSDARAVHVLSAEHRGRRVLAYEYSYSVCEGGRGRARVYRFCVVAVLTPPTAMLEVRAGQKGCDSWGGRRVRVGDEGFDEVFGVCGDDEAFAGAVLDGRVRAWLLERPGERAPFRFIGDYLLTWSEGGLDPEVAVARADVLVDLLERVPAGVWEGTRG